MSSKPVDVVLSQLRGVKRNGKKFTALCPAHEDRNNSLSVNECDDGRVLVNCFKGCPAEAVVAALGLTVTAVVLLWRLMFRTRIEAPA